MLKDKLEHIIQDFTGNASIIVKELDTENEWSINPKEVHRSASIIKLCILWELFSQANQNNLNLNDKVVLRKSDMVGGCGVLKEFNEGLTITLKEIATLMIIQSDNTATNILIDKLGMENINNSIKNLGLENTILERKMMDSEAVKIGLDNYTTPEDMKNLLQIFIDTNLISQDLKREMIDILKKQQLNGKIPSMLPEDAIFAHKTGELSDVEHDVGILFLHSKKIIIVSMLKNVSNSYDARIIHNKIGKAIYDYFI